jgi:hypothetical protein
MMAKQYQYKQPILFGDDKIKLAAAIERLQEK